MNIPTTFRGLAVALPVSTLVAIGALVMSPRSTIAAAGSSPSTPAVRQNVYTLSPTTYGQQLKTPDGRVVWEYITKKPENTALTTESTACFHPINTPTGETITAFAPNDHPHHRGMYLGWHDAEFRTPITSRGPTSPLFGWNVTKADFWGWGVYASREGRVISTTSIKLVGADAQSAKLEIHNDWNIVGGNGSKRKWAEETVLATTTEREGVFVMDMQYTVAPVVDYVLFKNAFGGFNLQARKDGTSYYTNSNGKVPYRDAHYSVPESDWPAATWYGYVITLTGNGKTLGAAVLDHPSNPPSLWHGSRGLWMLNPSTTSLGTITIHPDQPLTLKYRVVVHDGPTPTALVDKLSDEFRAIK